MVNSCWCMMKSNQYCKAIINQLKINIKKKKKIIDQPIRHPIELFYCYLYLHKSFTLYVVKFVDPFVSGFWVLYLAEKDWASIVYRALSFLFSHAGLGHRDSVKCIESPPEIRKRRVREGKWLISGHTATSGRLETRIGVFRGLA